MCNMGGCYRYMKQDAGRTEIVNFSKNARKYGKILENIKETFDEILWG